MRIRNLFWALLVMSTCFEVAADDDPLEGFDAFMAESMAATGIPGIAVSIVKGDEVLVVQGFGVLQAGNPERVNEDTLFAIGSNSKYFTATLLGLLVADGRMSWDKPLTYYLPTLRFANPVLFTELTLRDAMSHRTGLQRADLAWYAIPGSSRTDVLSIIETLAQEIPFRSGFLYNNFMLVAAGETIPAVTGMSWDDFLAEQIFEPLQMSRSNTSIRDFEGVKNVARPHSMIEGRAVPIDYYNLDHMGPAGSINSSVSDMAQWCRLQLSDGMIDGKQLMPEAVFEDIRQPQNLLPLSKDGLVGTIHSAYALGIERSDFGPGRVAYVHTGGIDGMVSSFVLLPEQDLCITVLTNGSPPYGMHITIPIWIVKQMFGLENDYSLEELKEDVAEQLAEEKEILRDQHDRTHDEDAEFSLSMRDYAGTYSHETFGVMNVEYVDGTLRLQYGLRYQGELRHHRNDSFDLVHDSETLNYVEPTVLNFALDSGGQVESVLLQIVGDEAAEVRFMPRAAKANNDAH